jgi:hypothetical protein
MGHTEAAMYASCMEDLANPALLDGAERSYLEAKAVALCGMTLSDYFAAKAMQGVVSGLSTRGEPLNYKECALFSYELADAMLKAREQ